MVLLPEALDCFYLPFCQIIALKLFYSPLFVLHPQYSTPIKIKRNINLRNFKLPIRSYFVFCNVNFMKIIFLLLQFRS